jgi:O-methyltransferase
MLWRLLRQLTRSPARPTREPLPGPAATDGRPQVKPFFALFNKMYREAPYNGPERMQAFSTSLKGLSDALEANRTDGHAFLADDTLVWFRNLGFLRDGDFVQACGPHAQDQIIRARIWRVYTLCWAARSSLSLPGDYVDIGCYDGKTVEIMARYVDFARQGREWFLYDVFDAPPEEARKAGHGPQLQAQVEARLRGLGRFRVIPGYAPGSFRQGLPERIAFVQLDLNVAQAEIDCLEQIYERIVPGGLLVLDDYGFSLYRDTHEAEKRFFAQRGASVLELPTGQGLLIKR